MSGVNLRKIEKRYGSVDVIHGVDIDVEPGEFCVFVGPSGCGKSTLLRMIAGLEAITAGEMMIGGQRVNEVHPSRRGVAMVFQTYALYPHMSVEQNMGFGLRMNGHAKEDVARRVEKAARILRIEHLMGRKPKQLSGGQRQRVAIGRAIVREPQVFLFDEPLSNLDAELRVATRLEIAKLHRELDGPTVIYVTHDQVEAMTLADKIVVLREGVVEQIGSPMDLYHRPANLFVAGFIGSPKMNFLDIAVESEAGDVVCRLPSGAHVKLVAKGKAKPAEATVLGVRADQLRVSKRKDAPIVGEISVVERLGDNDFVYFRFGDKELVARFDGESTLSAGDRIGFEFKGRCHFFTAEGSALDGVTVAGAETARRSNAA